jgi:hypothetical protein
MFDAKKTFRSLNWLSPNDRLWGIENFLTDFPGQYTVILGGKVEAYTRSGMIYTEIEHFGGKNEKATQPFSRKRTFLKCVDVLKF